MAPHHISASSRRAQYLAQTALILAAIILLFSLSAWTLGGWSGLLIFISALVASGALWPASGPGSTLDAQAASPLSRRRAPWLNDMVAALAARAGLERSPSLWLIPDRRPNALATGDPRDPREPAVGLTVGLLESMRPAEVMGVLAHEIAHLRQGDLRLMQLAVVLERTTRLISSLAWFTLLLAAPLVLVGLIEVPLLTVLVLMIAPTASSFLLLALSRTRELSADLEAARITGHPAALASALVQLERHPTRFWERLFAGPTREDPWAKSHPDTALRVRRLLELEPSRPHLEQKKNDANSSRPRAPSPRTAPLRARRDIRLVMPQRSTSRQHPITTRWIALPKSAAPRSSRSFAARSRGRLRA